MLQRCFSATRSGDLLRLWVARCLFVAVTLYATASPAEEAATLRIATYNVSLYGKKANEIRDRLSDGKDLQAEKIAAVVQAIRPDILLLNELDFDADAVIAKSLAEKFFAVPQGDGKPVEYPFVRALASNTGVDSGLDLNHNGQGGEPNDAWGFGVYPGQYAMAVFSRFPIDDQAIRTFQKYRWKDFPGALRPVDPTTDETYDDDPTWSQLRLSSKNHVDLPIHIGDLTLHVLASHPTPPVFDGPEDRNGCRNHDEIRFWTDYLEGPSAEHLIDDRGLAGGLSEHASFVVMGDLNADPADGDGRREAILALLRHRRLSDPQPRSEGAVEAMTAKSTSGKRKGDPALHTASFGRNGNMRLDYVLPSRSLQLLGSGVHWPKQDDPQRAMIDASDHRLVWIDVIPPRSGRQ